MHEIQTRNFLISIPWSVFNQKPFPKKQILDPSKLKEFADNDFKFDVNGKKFSKRVENTVGKGEIARFSTVFSKGLCCRDVKLGLVWERIKNTLSADLQISLHLVTFEKKTSILIG